MRYFWPIPSAAAGFGPYKKFSPALYRRVLALGGELRGQATIHINSTAAGGGVAELLKTQVPLEKGLGLNSRWLVLRQPRQFFFITKKIHNLLQGQKGFLSEPEKNITSAGCAGRDGNWRGC